MSAALLALVLTAQLAPSPGLPLAPAPSPGLPRIGLFVGNNDAPAGRDTLAYAEADAERMRQVFLDLGGLAPEHAVLLRGASADQILDAIARLPATGAMLVFYYSGHADDRALLLGHSELPLTELTAALDRAAPAFSLRLVDACRSGALTRRKGARLGERLSVGATPTSAGRVVITSSAEWEDSQESDRLGGSFFTLHLASALRGAADANADAQVTLDEAYRYVYGRTVESTLGTAAGPQHPTYAYDLSGRGEVVLTWTERSGGALLLGAGDYLIVDEDSGAIVAELTPRAPTRLSLAPGEYRVRKRTRNEVWSGRFSLAAGMTVMAEPILVEREAHARLVRKGGARDPGSAHRVGLSGGVRGAVDDGVGASPLLRASYELALPWLSVEPYLTLATGAELRTDRLTFDTWELGVGAAISRVFDVPWVTLRASLLAEAVRIEQSEVASASPDRTTWGAAVGAGAAIESPPLLDLSLALGGEAMFYAYRRTDARQTPTGEGELATRPTYRLWVGLRYEL